jgi:hypothetical protein
LTAKWGNFRLQFWQWNYSFRFLLANIRSQQTPLQDESAAMTSLRAIEEVAMKRGDHYVYVLANIAEASMQLKHGTDGVEVAKAALDRAQPIDLNEAPQLLFLWQMLNMICSIILGNNKDEAISKTFQKTMDLPSVWQAWDVNGNFIVPVKASNERAKPSELRFCWLPKADLWALGWFMIGTRTTSKNPDVVNDPNNRRAERCLFRGLETVDSM